MIDLIDSYLFIIHQKMDDQQINFLLNKIKKSKTKPQQSLDIPAEKAQQHTKQKATQRPTPASVDDSKINGTQQSQPQNLVPQLFTQSIAGSEQAHKPMLPLFSPIPNQNNDKPSLFAGLPLFNKQTKGDIQVKAPPNIIKPKTGNPFAGLTTFNSSTPPLASKDFTVKLSEGALQSIKRAKEKKENELKEKERLLEKQREQEKEKEREKSLQKDKVINAQKKDQIEKHDKEQSQNKSNNDANPSSKIDKRFNEDQIEEGQIKQTNQLYQVKQNKMVTENTADSVQKEQNLDKDRFTASDFTQPTPIIAQQPKPIFPNPYKLFPQPPTHTIIVNRSPIPQPSNNIQKPNPVRKTTMVEKPDIKQKIRMKQIHRLRRIQADLECAYEQLSVVADMKKNNQLTPEMVKKLRVIKLALS